MSETERPGSSGVQPRLPGQDGHESEAVPSSPSSALPDLYGGLFGRDTGGTARVEPAEAPRGEVTPPPAPVNLHETGLSLSLLCDLLLKHLYLQSNLLGVELARQLRLPFPVIDECLRYLKDEKCTEVASGDLVGPASYRFCLTELGRGRAREAFEQCRYVGPAPVTLESYAAQCRLQTVAGSRCTPEALQEAFEGMIIRPGLLEEVGPAVCSGKSIFVYGPPGNGKTMIARGLGRFLNTSGGEIHVPYAVLAENSIVTVFDPTVHQATDEEAAGGGRLATAGRGAPGTPDSLRAIYSGAQSAQKWDESTPDLRWRRVRRPVVVTGGELTLDMLDLRYSRTSNFYTAPLHIKANGGVFLIDDFGRQIVSPRDLLNRWILPLEEGIDFLTLATGKKFSIPFEQLIIFSTNLEPRELVDEAFLRRIRHKIRIGPPERDHFTRIFRLCCTQRQIPYDEAAVEHLYVNFYDQGKSPRSSDARDLLEIAVSICRFRNQPPVLTTELMAEATARFFCQV